MQGITGCGLGLRREFLDELLALPRPAWPAWFEITPENWITTPARQRASFEAIIADAPVVAHGLSLSPGSLESPNIAFLKQLKSFLDAHNIRHYSEHLSFSSLGGVQSYELLPLPMTRKMARFVADKLLKIRDVLQREVILENATYYFCPYAEMEEVEFIHLVLEWAQTRMLLDVNNLYVNARNHHFDAVKFLDMIDLERVAYLHVAGHWCRSDDLIIDTHGQRVCDEVWELLASVLQRRKIPVLLERDNHIPPLAELMEEYHHMKGIYENSRT